MSALRSAWRLAFEGTPVILTGGIAQNIPGGMLPIIALTEIGNFTLGLLNGNIPSLDQLLAHWQILSGTQLIRNSIGAYPFANQIMAANAIIREPLSVSLIMHVPVQGNGGYWTKLATIAGLKASLDLHSDLGGTYTVLSPSWIYTNCILLDVVSTEGSDSNQDQAAWQFNFIQPLIANPETSGLNSYMKNISDGIPMQPDTSGIMPWSGIKNVINALSSSIPGLSGLPGAA